MGGRKTALIVCEFCKKEIYVYPYEIKKRKHNLCLKCLNSYKSGEKSSTWKGGHRYYSKGRFGKDKNGLSWKRQRKLALERDNYTCQKCNEYNLEIIPDVHHIVPWRISFSHDLSNLICYCKSCHLKIEATIQTKWNKEKVVFRKIKIVKYKLCNICNRKIQTKKEYKINNNLVCSICYRKDIINKVKLLKYQEDWSYPQIAKHLKISVGVAHKYANLDNSSKLITQL